MHRRRIAGSIILAFLITGSAAVPLAAQAGSRSARITFRSASASENGFLHGSLDYDYRVANCGYGPRVMYTVRPGGALGYEGYWYEGKMYGLQPGWERVSSPSLKTTFVVMFGAEELERWEAVNPQASSHALTCGDATQFVGLGSWSDLLGAKSTAEQKTEALGRITMQQEFFTDRPLRSEQVEREIRRQLAAAEEAPEEAARTESPRPQPAVTAPRPSTSSSAQGSGSGSVAAGSQQRPMSYEDVNRRRNDSIAAAIEERRRSVEARDAARREMMAGLEEMAREYGRMRAEEEAAERERREQRYEEWRQKWEAEYAVVRAENFAKAGHRPRCVPGQASMTIEREGQLVGRLDGTECRLEGNESADVYRFGSMKMGKMQIRITPTGFRPVLILQHNGYTIATSEGGYLINAHFTVACESCYTLIVTSQDYGEVGTYVVETDWLGWSQASGVSVSPFFRFGSLESDEGEDTGDTAGWGLHVAASWWKLKGFVEFASETGSLPYTNEFDRERTSWHDATSWMVGARYLFLDQDATFRPYLEFAYGLRRRDGMGADVVYKGGTIAPGAGVEMFAILPFTATLGVSQFRTAYDLVEGGDTTAPETMTDTGLIWTLGVSWYIQPVSPY